jgi:hypothetical protein
MIEGPEEQEREEAEGTEPAETEESSRASIGEEAESSRESRTAKKFVVEIAEETSPKEDGRTTPTPIASEEEAGTATCRADLALGENFRFLKEAKLQEEEGGEEGGEEGEEGG